MIAKNIGIHCEPKHNSRHKSGRRRTTLIDKVVQRTNYVMQSVWEVENDDSVEPHDRKSRNGFFLARCLHVSRLNMVY